MASTTSTPAVGQELAPSSSSSTSPHSQLLSSSPPRRAQDSVESTDTNSSACSSLESLHLLARSASVTPPSARNPLPSAEDTSSLTSQDEPADTERTTAQSSPLLPSSSNPLPASSPSHVSGLHPSEPATSTLRQRKAAIARRDSGDPDSPQTDSVLQQSSGDQSRKQNEMFGSNPNTGYLPLNSRRPGPPSPSNLKSWIAKHKKLVAFVIVATMVSAQIYLVGPVVMELEPVKKIKAEGWPAVKPSEWWNSIASSTSSWISADNAIAFNGGELGPDSFPPVLSEVSLMYTPHSQATLYKDTNPHRGELPTYLEEILNRQPQHQPPPWPMKAPSIAPEIWATRTWADRSTSQLSDAEQPATQKQEKEWREAPYDAWKAPVEELSQPAKALPRVQHAFEDPTKHSGRRKNTTRDELIAYRQKTVRNAFIHAWEGYKKHAWGHDELKPVSKMPNDPFNGWGASIVDALDTLLIMDLPKEYDLARQHVRDIDFRLIAGGRSAYGHADGKIPVFETAIRYLGGFLSAYDLSGDVLMRDRAEELAQLILPAFDTNTGVPVGRLKMNDNDLANSIRMEAQGGSVLAEAGSMLLEFTRLWQVTGNRTYFDRVQRTTDWLDHNMTAAGRVETLFPTRIYPERNQAYGSISFGGMADSYYEYLIKEHQLLGGRLAQYSRMYSDAIEGAKKLLIRSVDTVPGVTLTTIGEMAYTRYTAKLEHLTCFSGGMLGLGSRLMSNRSDDIGLAKNVTGTCWWAYNSTATGIGPESLTFYTNEDEDRFDMVHLPDGTTRRGKARGAPIVGVRSVATQYLNRPETIESVFYMWRITGDPVWQERGWQMFASWVTHCMTDVGFSAIYDVNRSPADWSDNMESFTFAETFKYYYLLFSPPDLISLDEYVFTTEAHPLLAPQNGKWAQPGHGSKRFWDADATEDMHLPSPTSGIYSGGERGQIGGLTNYQKQMVWDEWQTKSAAVTIRDLINGLGGDALRNGLRRLIDRKDDTTQSAAESNEPVQESHEEALERRDDVDSEKRNLLAAVEGTSVYEADDGTVEVEFADDIDEATQKAMVDRLEANLGTLDATKAASLLRSVDAVRRADEEAERSNFEHGLAMARLRAKGIRM